MWSYADLVSCPDPGSGHETNAMCAGCLGNAANIVLHLHCICVN